MPQPRRRPVRSRLLCPRSKERWIVGLNSPLETLTGVASNLSGLAGDAHAALPNSTIVPAAGDPISAVGAHRLNARANTVVNRTIDGLNVIHPTAYQIGDSAQAYSLVDNRGAESIGGKPGDSVTNPVADPTKIARRPAAPAVPDMPTGAFDPLTYATLLHTGPGPGSTTTFTTDVIKFTNGPHLAAGTGVDHGATSLESWTPIGTQLSGHFNQFRGWLDQMGGHYQDLINGANGYTNAFQNAKAKHPTPDEIVSAQNELLAANRAKPKDPARITAAVNHLNELYTQSRDAVNSYRNAIDELIPGSPDDPAAPPELTSDIDKVLNLPLVKQLLDDQKKLDDEKDKPQTPEQIAKEAELQKKVDEDRAKLGKWLQDSGAGGTQGNPTNPNGTSPAQNQKSPMDPSTMAMMAQMMSTLGQAGLNNRNANGDLSDELGDPGALPASESMSPLNFAGSDGGGYSSSAGGVDVPQIGSMEAATAPGASSSAAPPRAPVMEPVSAGPAGGPTRGGPGGGMPMAPYGAPMAPGGKGGMKERDRIVAWHPDRLMYVDDTPHTEAVIGEQPVIAPTVTNPTPNPGKSNPNQTGGAA